MKAGTDELNQTLNNVISEVDRMSTANITESEFKNTYLPIILAIHNQQRPVLNGWVNKTGSIYNGFTVTEDDSDTVLFKTPGLFVESSFEIEAGLTSMISDLGHDHTLKLDPANTYAKHLNSDRAKLRLGDSGEHHIAWYRIFARFGYKMRNTTDDSVITVSATDNKPQTQLDWGDDEFA